MFTPNFFKFFKTLAKNNNREWFNEHKSDYQQQVVVVVVLTCFKHGCLA
jgi:uncharacterized protein (DUF2461 family)